MIPRRRRDRDNARQRRGRRVRSCSTIIGGGGAAVDADQLTIARPGLTTPPGTTGLFNKQTAAPAGLLITGFLGPAMAGALGWRGAVLITAVAYENRPVLGAEIRTGDRATATPVPSAVEQTLAPRPGCRPRGEVLETLVHRRRDPGRRCG